MVNAQLNIMLPQELIQDLNIISSILEVDKSKWIKIKLAEEIPKEKSGLLIGLSTLYAKGMITRGNMEKLVGIDVAREMEFIKNKARESAEKKGCF